MKKYFFALGTNHKLSLAEIKALFPSKDWQISQDIAFSEFNEEIDSLDLISKMGGVIKIGEIIKEFSLANRRALSEAIKEEIFVSAEKNVSKKFNFGFSFYNKKVPGDFFKMGLAIKKELKKEGISSRMVTSRDLILSSVVVEQNNLLENGIELCLIVFNNRVVLAKTLAVQAFKDLSKRDFGRPKRDDHSGMIPPKLAQIMINLARGDDGDYKNKIILDPFCGSGTILMEAYLMGFKNIIGSDLSERAILDSQENINWIVKLKEENKTATINIFQSDALDLLDKVSENSVDYIVCEPYLGPQRGYQDFDLVVADLNKLYSSAIKIFSKIMKKNGRVVMIWPNFRSQNKFAKISPDTFDFKSSAVSVYGREGQKVWREIVVLEK